MRFALGSVEVWNDYPTRSAALFFVLFFLIKTLNSHKTYATMLWHPLYFMSKKKANMSQSNLRTIHWRTSQSAESNKSHGWPVTTWFMSQQMFISAYTYGSSWTRCLIGLFFPFAPPFLWAPPPPPKNEARGHSVFPSRTVSRWLAQQHTLGYAPIQPGACRFPSIPTVDAPFD